MADSYFLPELLREILLKLPAKSLLRLTAVYKSWHSVITSFPFISAHLAQTPHSDTLIVRRYVSTSIREHYNQPFYLNFTSELNFPFNIQLGYFRIIGSCNGILCLADDLFGELRSLILWNPSIQKFIALPMPSIKPQSPHMFVFGFGVDLSKTDDYKLVRLVYRKNDVVVNNDPPEIEIYSINSRI